MNRFDRNDLLQEKLRTNGLGVLCREAQADGVPCAEIGRPCTECGRAADPPEEEAAEPAEREPSDWCV